MQTALHLMPSSPARQQPQEECVEMPGLLVGPSAAMLHLRGQIQRVAPYFRTALLTGERDCGEEDVARELHRLSPLAHRPFVELVAIDSQLRLSSSAIVTLATEGMIYLPYPERLERPAQAALLRLLRERRSNAPRIVVFAEHGLRPLVSTGAFLPELAETLSALRIAVPPLRERKEDIPSLFSAVFHRSSPNPNPISQSPELLDWAMQQPWPGNIAQLESAIERLAQRASSGPFRPEDLQDAMGTMPIELPNDRREVRLVRLDQVIQEHIRAVLFACNGNKLRAAEILGISRSTLYRMLDATTVSTSLPLAG